MRWRFIFVNKTLSDDHKNLREIDFFRISAFHSISISRISRSSNLPFSQTHSFPNHSPNIPPSPWARSSRHMSLAFEAIAGHTMAQSWKCHHGRAWDPGPATSGYAGPIAMPDVTWCDADADPRSNWMPMGLIDLFEYMNSKQAQKMTTSNTIIKSFILTILLKNLQKDESKTREAEDKSVPINVNSTKVSLSGELDAVVLPCHQQPASSTAFMMESLDFKVD